MGDRNNHPERLDAATHSHSEEPNGSGNGKVEADGSRQPEDKNIKAWGLDAHPVVTPVAGVAIVFFIVLTLLFQTQAETFFTSLQSGAAKVTDWFFILVTNLYLGVVLLLAFGKFGSIRLGGPGAKPEFSTSAWFAMLFSAGMGIGLMFWSVAEPIFHFESPPTFWGNVDPGSADAARAAMGTTFFHWGFHAWGIYSLVGLALAFFAFNRKLPLTIRSVFYPLLGDRIYGWPGNLIDILALLATLFGLATSLGFGVLQVNSGLNFLFGAPVNTGVQVLLIAVITGFATLSVVAGLDKGVRFLSEVNIYIAAALMFFVLLFGPTLFLLGSFVENLGYYFSVFPALSFWTETFEGTNWQDGWTISYWGWWIAWSPFVGTFIARVSKGRTIREFVIGVLIVPSFLSFFWLSVFGGTALNLALAGDNPLVESVTGENGNEAVALFVMLRELPLPVVSAAIGVLLVVTFFVTSSDSGSLVVDNLASGGKLDSPVPQRVMWAVTEGVVAAVLLLGGGLKALQTASVATGLPFAGVLLVMCYSLYRGLASELAAYEAARLARREAAAALQYAPKEGEEVQNLGR